ncbi:amino acid permease [Fulvivirgaceae bacterium PWU4]|uniref:Amino acid permease n=1 Tax=Chryseosolibacter histidini TaxID=2782349 RepID=A0AAP2DJF3_9BACT|nr:amino acid permease [Chryseosolibacter histidini]MBT1697473.1 amino acid permease [Chryseosolibacter histidini]
MQQPKLIPALGFWTSVSLVVGGIIGSGIFMKPAIMASQLGSPELLIAVWIVAGIITIFGALSNAEVAAMMPETGGQFVFFKAMYGDFFAFLYGWSAFAVFNTAGVASIAYVLGTYTEYFVQLPRFSPETERSLQLYIPFIGSIFPLHNIGVKGVTIMVVLGLTYVNYRSTRSGGDIQVVFTLLKVVAMALIIAGLLFSGQGDAANLVNNSATTAPTGWALVGALVAAISGAFWGYDGWNNITFVAGEIRDPQRNIPKSLLTGLVICTAIYAFITMAYCYVLPIDSVAASSMVASDAATVVMGSAGGACIALMVIISTFGTTNGNVLATARVSFAMAQQKQFFPFTGQVHPRFQTPGNALWLHGIWTSILVLSGSFDMLTDMLIFVSWLFYGMSAAGIFVLRKKLPHAERPYRVWGYPLVPAIFVAFTLFFLIATVVNDIRLYSAGKTDIINSLLGLLLTALGIPLYWYFKGVHSRRSTDHSSK